MVVVSTILTKCVIWPADSPGGTVMVHKHFVGLDVSARSVSVCVVSTDGSVVHESKLGVDPAEIATHFQGLNIAFERIGLEAGMRSQYLYAALAAAGLPVVCVETRHMKAALSAQMNKTDRHDARGIAQMMRVGLFKSVHVKTPESQRLRTILTSRQLLKTKCIDITNAIRGFVRELGYDVGKVSARDFEARVRELADGTEVMIALEPLLAVRRELLDGCARLDDLIVRFTREDVVCRRLMTVPGVGPVVALTFRATVDVPSRFARSRAVGAHFGLTPRKFQSGEIDKMGRISR
jgi:transposase